MKELVRQLPAVYELQQRREFNDLLQQFQLDKKTLTQHLKSQLEEIRQAILNDQWSKELQTPAFFVEFFGSLTIILEKKYSFQLQPVINGTGAVLHTNLGRARLSEAAISQVVSVARHYSNLEYDLQTAKRSSRHALVEHLLTEITGAEAAMVINNNAAAVYLILRALSNGQEVVISRGELIEIGGSFRVSAIMEESGAILKEVGTTNKTYMQDYEQAIHEETAMLMKVHPSNFKQIGFIESTSNQEIVQLAQAHGVISYVDLGSGALFDFKAYDIGEEQLVQEVIASGMDIVSFSGDKLLGGPQAGIIVGKKQFIEKLKKHQLARVLRMDKLSLAALEATLNSYLKGPEVAMTIPLIRDLLQTEEDIHVRANRLIDLMQEKGLALDYFICSDESVVGGGTMPGVFLETIAVGLKLPQLSAEETHRLLRTRKPAVIGKIVENVFWLDLRMITDEELPIIVSAIEQLTISAH